MGLALALAISYTKVLGIEKRLILALITVSALTLTLIFTRAWGRVKASFKTELNLPARLSRYESGLLIM